MARYNGPINVWNRTDTVPTDAQGGYAGGDSTAAAISTALDTSRVALVTAESAVTGGQFGPVLSQMTLVERASLTNPGAPRPVWAGIVDWWVSVGSAAPTNAIPGDLVTEVSSDAAPWQPTDLDGLGGWYSAQFPGTAPGNAVTNLPDRSGLERHAAIEVGTVIHSPIGLNGTPALTFGADSRLRTGTFPAGDSGVGPLTFAWTGQFEGTTGAHFFFGARHSTAAGTTHAGRNGAGDLTMRRSGTTSTTGIASDASVHTYTVVFDGTTARLYVDGTLVSTGASSASRFDDLMLGGSTTVASGTETQYYFPGGKIGDLLWLTGALDTDSPATFTDVQNWLKVRAGMA